MTAVLVGQFTPGSDDWHAARAHGLGGSEISAVLGLSPFDSRFSLWHRKAGAVGPVEQTPEMEWGTRLEPVILGKYREQHPDLDYEVRNGTFVHDERRWQVVNPDLLAADRVIESKYSIFGDDYGEPGTDEVPVHVRTQVLWYCDVLDQPFADIAVLVGGYDYREYRVEYDADEAAELRDAGRQFLDEVAAGVLPDIDEHSATYQTIREMHPEIDGADVDLPDDIALRYIAARVALKATEDEEQLARSLVADQMGNAKRAMWDGRCIATRQARGDGTPYVVAGRNLHKTYAPEGEAA